MKEVYTKQEIICHVCNAVENLNSVTDKDKQIDIILEEFKDE